MKTLIAPFMALVFASSALAQSKRVVIGQEFDNLPNGTKILYYQDEDTQGEEKMAIAAERLADGSIQYQLCREGAGCKNIGYPLTSEQLDELVAEIENYRENVTKKIEDKRKQFEINGGYAVMGTFVVGFSACLVFKRCVLAPGKKLADKILDGALIYGAGSILTFTGGTWVGSAVYVTNNSEEWVQANKSGMSEHRLAKLKNLRDEFATESSNLVLLKVPSVQNLSSFISSIAVYKAGQN